MKVQFTNAFDRDISKIKNQKVAGQILSAIENMKSASSLSEISGVKKMHGATNAFRMKVKDFRIGFYFEKDSILISRVLDRKDIYKYFP
jgi:mRNA interferase RelE/StbE